MWARGGKGIWENGGCKGSLKVGVERVGGGKNQGELTGNNA